MPLSHSVVIPVYNGSRYIRRSVQSALIQDPPAAQILVVDDGSTDGSGELAKAVAPDRVTVLRHDPNRGLSAARNTGIAAATGDVIALMDSDDEWRPGKMAAQLALYDADPSLEVVFCDFRGRDLSGNDYGWQGGVGDDMRTKHGLTLEPKTADGFAVSGPVVAGLVKHTSFIHPSSLTCRRAVYDRVGLFEVSIKAGGEDLEMWLRMADACRLGVVDRVLVDVESRPDSLGHHVIRMTEALTRVYAAVPKKFPHLPADVLGFVRTYLRREYVGLAWHLRRAGNRADARRYYRQSLRHGLSLRAVTGLARTYLPAV